MRTVRARLASAAAMFTLATAGSISIRSWPCFTVWVLSACSDITVAFSRLVTATTLPAT